MERPGGVPHYRYGPGANYRRDLEHDLACHAIRLYVARVDEFYFLIYGSATVTDQLIIIIIRSVYDTSRIWYSKIWYN